MEITQGPIKRIDSHQHFWHYTEAEFAWINSPAIQRDFLPPDFEKIAAESGVHGSIAVQARTSLDETRWLLDLAQQNAFIQGVVGWVPWDQPEALKTLCNMPGREWLKGLRILIQGNAPEMLECPALNENVAGMAAANLVCDLLLTGDQLPAVMPFVRRHPQQTFIIDHCAKPDIDPDRFDSEWASNLEVLAGQPNTVCKVSGLVTEVASPTWSIQSMQTYWDSVSASFGADRLLFGSDWPVCLSRIRYKEWVQVLDQWTEDFDTRERAAFWAENATRLYALKQN